METEYTTNNLRAEYTFHQTHDELGEICLRFSVHAFGSNQKLIELNIYSMNDKQETIFKGSFADLVGLLLKAKYPPMIWGNKAEVIDKARELIPETCPHCERDLDVSIPGIIEALADARSSKPTRHTDIPSMWEEYVRAEFLAARRPARTIRLTEKGKELTDAKE